MTRKSKALIATASILALLGGGSLAAESIITSRIETRIKSELPKASGVSASIPLIDMVQSIFSDSIKSANFRIDSYALKESTTESSIAIAAKNNEPGKVMRETTSSMCSAVSSPGRTPGTKPPLFLRSSAILLGLIMIAV